MSFNGKKILDCTCGSRSIWFDKYNKDTLYCDIRQEEHHGMFGKGNHKKARDIFVKPDMLVDFTAMPFPDNSFKLVVFDPPPNQKSFGEFMAKKDVWELRWAVGRNYQERV